jgi:hypothetical protein
MASFRSLLPIASALALICGLAACGPSAPKVEGGTPDMRRLTEEQYANIVADVFGSQIQIAGRFDPLLRTDGLVALGARSARITPAGFEQYYELAKSIAAQVTAPANRDDLIPCKPAKAGPDDACARTFFAQVGRLLYRRPLAPKELDTPVKAAHDFATTTGDFYEGLANGLAGMLTTPQFLFVADTTEPDPEHAGQVRLTAYAKASRLSFLLWNTNPDDQLLAAADAGDLGTARGLERQVDRMLASPKVDQAVRAFFKDFLDFARFETLEKDPVIYPAYGLRVTEDAKEQLLRTVTDHLVTRAEDYRDLYTTRRTFITPALARIYHVPAGHPDGGWSPYEFPKDDPRAGIITQIGFVAANSHPGRSSPTLRGRAIRELLLCQKVPDPPGNVDFSVFTDPNSPNKTARDRLTAHRTSDSCAGCHKITDPIGLGLENFDGAGEFRTAENGVAIDASGELDGVPYKDGVSLGKAIHDSPATTSCLVNRMAAYAVGRATRPADGPYLAYLEQGFARSGYKLPELLRRIALSDYLYAVIPPKASQSAGDAARQETKS